MANIYKHYKSGKLYELIGEGTDSETLEEVVVYRSVIDKHIWVRPKEMFFETLDSNGERFHRFEKQKEGDNPVAEVPLLPRC